MPLQSGNDRVLKLMNRNYRRDRYLKIISSIKDKVPEMSITTDIIVGFPGETESEFQDTLSVMKEVQFDNSYSFIFSPRPGTAAEFLEDTLSYEEKLDRLQRLQAKQLDITTNRLKSWIGKTGQILVEGGSAHDEKLMFGRLSQNILVNLTEESPGLLPGMLADVEITGAAKFTLKGRVTSK